MKSHFKTVIFCLLTINCLSCAHLGFSDECEPKKQTFEDGDFQVQTLSYYPKNRTDQTILIMPPTGGTNIIDKSYATHFCKSNYQVHILSGWTNDRETVIDFEIHQRFYTNAQKAISTTLLQVTTPFVGLLGTSVGGLHASIAASTQDRIQAVFVITAGSPIAEVVVYSKQKAMIDLNKRRKEKFKTINDEDQIQRIDQVFELELQKLKPQYLKKDLGLSIALQDTIVPIQQQEKLRKLWNPQTVIEINNDHFFGILKTWLFYTDEILEFFNKSKNSKN